jgi:exodeoxyribonuclease VII small subunit
MEQYTLDTAMLRLQEITGILEKNECDLDMSMKLYEEGVHLVSFCSKALADCKQRIIELGDLDTGDEDHDTL